MATRGRCFPEPAVISAQAFLHCWFVEASPLSTTPQPPPQSTGFFSCCLPTAPHLAGLQYVDLFLIHGVFVLFQETFTLIFHLCGERSAVCVTYSLNVPFNHTHAGHINSRTNGSACVHKRHCEGCRVERGEPSNPHMSLQVSLNTTCKVSQEHFQMYYFNISESKWGEPALDCDPLYLLHHSEDLKK